MVHRTYPYKQRVYSTDIFYHPLYKYSGKNYNFALIKLNRKVLVNSYVNFACISSKLYTGDEGFKCFTPGFGPYPGG